MSNEQEQNSMKPEQNSLVKNVKKISKTAVKLMLREIAFDPRKPGPMKIVSDLEDSNYYEQRALEEIMGARALLGSSKESESLYKEMMYKAIRLLLLALYHRYM